MPYTPDKIKDMPMAFPTVHPGGHTAVLLGMSLRDYFAAKAMQAMIDRAVELDDKPEIVALAAYMFADAMLAERDK